MPPLIVFNERHVPNISIEQALAVGTGIADCRPHRSVRAERQHTAPTLNANDPHPHFEEVPLLVRPAARETRRPDAASGPVATARRSPWLASCRPQTPPTADRCLCSPASAVLWSCLTPRKYTSGHCGLATSPTDPLPRRKRMSPGSLGFHEKSFHPCLWS